MPEPTFPAQIRAVMTGPISRISDMATMPGSIVTAPKSTKAGLVWMVSTSPMIRPVMEISGNDLYPTW
jgi:CBS-domain-containing membrane protein